MTRVIVVISDVRLFYMVFIGLGSVALCAMGDNTLP